MVTDAGGEIMPQKLVAPGTDKGRRNWQTALSAGFSTHLFNPCTSLTLWKSALVVWSSCAQLHCPCSHTDLQPQCEVQKAWRGVCVTLLCPCPHALLWRQLNGCHNSRTERIQPLVTVSSWFAMVTSNLHSLTMAYVPSEPCKGYN